MNKRGYIAIAVIVLAAAAAVAYFGFLRPSSGEKSTAAAKGKVIVALDAGHGGKDPGATSGDYTEKVVNFAVMKKVEALFANDPQIRTISTRSVDVLVPLEERIRIAVDGGASLYVSLHVNSYSQGDVAGIETWVDTTRKPADPTWTLAAMLQNELSAATGARNRGIRTQESYTQRTTMPAVTVEMGYITNPTERVLLFDSAYQDKLAAGIAKGIRDFVAWRAANPAASASSGTQTAAPATSTPAKKP
jgi:N-acetylmuramoyl-L-alanine amidase